MPLYPKEKAYVLASDPNNSSRYLPINDLATTALQQTTWQIDRVNGLATNSGLPGFPVDSAATIALRLNGGVPGTRIQWPPGTKLLLQGAAPAVAISGTLATASTFARTSTQGQISITDSGVADFHPYAMSSATIGGLCHDKTAGGITWLYEPKSASGATGIIGKGKTAQVAGTASTPADATAFAAGALYEILTPVSVYFGNDSLTRRYPMVPSTVTTVTITWVNGAAVQPDVADPINVLFDADGLNSVVIYRLWGQSAFSGDIWSPKTSGDATNFQAPIQLQECRLDQGYILSQGVLRLFNCATTNVGVFTSGVYGAQASLVVAAGASYGPLQAQYTGVLKVGDDFLIDGNSAIVASNGGIVFVDGVSRWGTTGPAFSCGGGRFHFQSVFGQNGVTYGTVGAANAVINFVADDSPSQVHIQGVGTATAKFQWDSNVTNWTFPAATSGNNGWGFNQATGRYCGAADGTPTTNTWAHLDASVNAPGFGNSCIDPQSGCIVHSN